MTTTKARGRTQVLMTAELRKALPPLYTNEHVQDLGDVMVIGKFFNPYGAGTWYLTEFDGEDTLFGWADLGMTYEPELGYMSLSEFEDARHPLGFQGVERDAHWTPKPWREVQAELKAIAEFNNAG